MEILLVEDNEDDVMLTLMAMKRLGLGDSTQVCRDGAEAVSLLLETQPPVLPKLILLDLKLPKLDGIEVARRLKNDERTKAINIVMLTSSSRQADVNACLQAGANHYLTKSVEFGRFSEEIRQVIQDFLPKSG